LPKAPRGGHWIVIVDWLAVADTGAALSAGFAGVPHRASSALVAITKIATQALVRRMRIDSMRTRFVSVSGAIRGGMCMGGQECILNIRTAPLLET